MEGVNKVAVIGSGTMGAGIAQVAIQNGYSSILYDIDQQQLAKAKAQVFKRLERLVEKGRILDEESIQAKEKLMVTTDLKSLEKVDLVIEAAPEKLDIKKSIFHQLNDICSPETLFATNTSSLSITEIAGYIQDPSRLAGFHFFNPAPLMPLVEIVQGISTNQDTINRLKDFAEKIHKYPVVCQDTPGFIVNRVARPFYNEALRIMNDQVASVEQIDRIMKKAGGFKMGPFELQDLIGIDINLATTRTVYSSFYGENRFRPHYYQERMVQAGRLGRKTEGGFYDYASAEH
ncbi:3-hydroxyacyl-CoA dehydrogenase NAD-binding domain-containing protein [Halobacillus naozhouensis]|uniref:3-hydroxyacyl-CoA dehydrogenase NAD-binding domain-containing protein n=1 Tax=Halobacillus naozhouensis TaxID=554880 RepID=A0ABY8IYP6_9BACI|nr:3-hydroxyacyl-CoA dehydrogenase NAD-binding domain-containing protein [Halobacillus naozhouensis]WFT75359.1 3-hydroxyacyl-CoA dehydrogenase NAD-binding domain-containing protein [Halobacillus naozhouensis]